MKSIEYRAKVLSFVLKAMGMGLRVKWALKAQKLGRDKKAVALKEGWAGGVYVKSTGRDEPRGGLRLVQRGLPLNHKTEEKDEGKSASWTDYWKLVQMFNPI